MFPRAHLLLAGAVPEHYDLVTDIARHGLTDCVTLTGYLASDEAFTECIAACDVALNLRWPTAREVSGPWLRCLAAGKPTVIVDLAHLTDMPTSIRAPGGQMVSSGAGSVSDALGATPCAVAIDILDEDHSLRLAMRRLGTDDGPPRIARPVRTQRYWDRTHSIDCHGRGLPYA